MSQSAKARFALIGWILWGLGGLCYVTFLTVGFLVPPSNGVRWLGLAFGSILSLGSLGGISHAVAMYGNDLADLWRTAKGR